MALISYQSLKLTTRIRQLSVCQNTYVKTPILEENKKWMKKIKKHSQFMCLYPARGLYRPAYAPLNNKIGVILQ